MHLKKLFTSINGKFILTSLFLLYNYFISFFKLMKSGRFFLLMTLVVSVNFSLAQNRDNDTFFLAKKRGILGRLGRIISTTPPPDEKPKKLINPYLKFNGKRISSIEVFVLDFNQNINDSTLRKENFVTWLGNRVHRNTKEKVVRKNLFFKQGQKLLPFLIADNEKFLRDQEFVQDAKIIVVPSESEKNSVDVIVVIRDVFSIGGSINISSAKDFDLEVKDENLVGSGSRIGGSFMYDDSRNPKTGFGAEFLKRNIKGSFINWHLSGSNFAPSFNSGRHDALSIKSIFEKPLYSRYTAWTGALQLESERSYNRFINDSLFRADYKYNSFLSDFWLGYNFGHSKEKYTDHTNRLRHFVAMRLFYNHFFKTPSKFNSVYNYNYADLNGTLFSYSLYKQNFYSTNFIYGFGRTEDVPEGITASAIGGWTNKSGKKRAYYGLNGEGSFFTGKKYYGIVARAGTFTYKNKWEDTELMLGVDHFSELRKISTNWRIRHFVNLALAKQIHPSLNTPLFLNSDFGFPYFKENIEGNFRATINAETVFYNLEYFLGFRFAPFTFANVCLITPNNQPVSKSAGFQALGGGFRTRNESLIFGTVEFRAYYFPRVLGEMKHWKFDVSTNIKFKYNSTFIKRPDFVVAN